MNTTVISLPRCACSAKVPPQPMAQGLEAELTQDSGLASVRCGRGR